MYIDKCLQLSSEQAETTVAAHASTNVIDMVVAGRSFPELYIVIDVHTACTSAGSATVAFTVQHDSAEAFDTAQTLASVGATAIATLVAGYNVLTVRIPKGCLRYVRVLYTIGTAALTAGKFNAYLVETPQLHNVNAPY